MNITSTLLGVAVFGLVAVNSYGIFTPDAPPPAPVEVVSAVILTEKTQAGGTLEYEMEAKKNRPCRQRGNVLFHSLDTGDLKMAIASLPYRRIPVQEEPSIFRGTIELPKAVSTGQWELLFDGQCQPPGEPWYWPIYHPTMMFEVKNGEVSKTGDP